MTQPNEQLPQHFNTDAEQIRMTARERAVMRSNLQTYMYAPQPSPWYMYFFSHRVAVAWAFVVLLVVATPVTQAAYGSLPGDVLYPVKTHVLEEFEEFVKSGSEADYHVAVTERRLNESRAAFKLERTTEEVLEAVTTSISEHTEEALDAIQKLRDQGETRRALLLSANLSAALHANEQIFTRVSKTAPMFELATVAADTALIQEDDSDQGEEMSSDIIADSKADADDIFADITKQFVEDTSDEDLEVFISTELSLIQKKIPTITDAEELAELEETLAELLEDFNNNGGKRILPTVVELGRDLEIEELLRDEQHEQDDIETYNDIEEDSVELLPENGTTSSPVAEDDEPIQDSPLGDNAPTDAGRSSGADIPDVYESVPQL